jgi:hypothetical protein
MKKQTLQQITPHPYIQHSGLVVLPTVSLILWSAGSHSTDAGLEHSTSQINFTRSTLCSSSAKPPSLSAVYSPRSVNVTHTIALTFLAIRLSYIAIIFLLDHPTLSHSVLQFYVCLVSAGNTCMLLPPSRTTKYQAYRKRWRQGLLKLPQW